MDEWTDGWIEIDEWMETDEWTDSWRDWWMDGWIVRDRWLDSIQSCVSNGCVSAGLTHTQSKAVERVAVDAVQLSDQGDGKLYHDADLRRLPLPVLPTQSAHYQPELINIT